MFVSGIVDANKDCLDNNPKEHVRGTVPFKSTDLTLGRSTKVKKHYYDFFAYFLSSVRIG